MSSVGYASLSVIPSARGFGAALTKGIAPEMAAAGKTSGLAFGKGLLAGVAGVAVAGIAVVTGLGAIGKQFHDMSSTIRVETGKSGKSLDGLVTSAKNVGRGTAASLEDVGKTVAGLNVRLGLTGPVLETLSKQFLAAGRITKQSLDLKTVTGSFNAFNIKGKDTSKALDNLFQISQATGVGINELAAAATKGAPAFRQFGLSFSDSAALVGVLDKAGINSGKTIAALTIGLTKFAKEGKAPGPALRATIDQISAFTKKGKDAAAIKLAASIFGTRGAAQFVAAVKSGKVNLDDMMKSSGAGKDTILAAAAATSTFGSKWLKFKNNVLIAVEPLATRVFKAFGDGMQFMNDVGLPALEKYGAIFSAKVMPVLSRFGNYLTGTVIPAIKDFATRVAIPALIALGAFISGTLVPAFIAWGTFVYGTLIPGLISFGFWVNDNKGKIAVIAGIITALLIPVLINMGVQHTIAAYKAVAAWVTTKINAVTSAAAQVAASYRVIGGWVASAAAAVASGAETVAIWALYKAEAIKGAAITVASHARMAAVWVASKVSAVAQAIATSAAWVASAVATSAAWVASTARTIAGLARQAIAMLAQKAVMVAMAVGTAIWTAAQWLLNAALTANPIGIVIMAIAALVAVVVLIATKTTWFQTIWQYMTSSLAAAWRWMWNSVLAPIIRFVLNGFASITDGIASMLRVLSNIPGFGWAKTAADKMSGAAGKARALAQGIKDIPASKTVTVGVNARFTSIGANYTAAASHNLGARAAFVKGGTVRGGIKGIDSVPAMLMPEEFVVTRNGSNLGQAMAHFGVRGMAKGGFVTNAPLLPPPLNTRMNASFNALTAGIDYKKLMGGAMGGSGGAGGAGRWASTVLMVLAMLGQSPANLGAILRLINKESGGNPKAINLWDSNAKAGHPSGGLMQTIAGTFNAYAGPFRALGMFNGFASIFAGVNYILSRYHSIAAVDPLHHAGGYANGTNSAAPGYAWVGERGRELLEFGGGERVTPESRISRGRPGFNGGIDYDRLAQAMSRVQLAAIITPASIDDAIGARL